MKFTFLVMTGLWVKDILVCLRYGLNHGSSLGYRKSQLDWFLPFSQGGVSRDAEHYSEAQNVITSCFARQTGSACIFLPVIDWFAPFSQEGAFSGWQPKLRSLKCENRANKPITGRKMLALPVWGAKQEVTPFWTSPLSSASRKTSFLRKRH